jgi:hypothetical protein
LLEFFSEYFHHLLLLLTLINLFSILYQFSMIFLIIFQFFLILFN